MRWGRHARGHLALPPAPYGIDLLTIGDNRRTEGRCSDLADNGREHIWLRDGIMLPAARAADCCA